MAPPRARLPRHSSVGGVGSHETSEILRQLSNMFRVGKVVKTDAKKRTLDIDFGDNKPMALPQMTQRAGGDQTYSMHDKDEQVLVICPDGDMAKGLVIGALYKDDPGAPFDDEDHSGIRHKDGTIVKHDRKNKTTTVTLPEGGKHIFESKNGNKLTLSDEGLHYKGKAVVDGDTELLKKLTVEQDSHLKGGNNQIDGVTNIPGLTGGAGI